MKKKPQFLVLKILIFLCLPLWFHASTARAGLKSYITPIKVSMDSTRSIEPKQYTPLSFIRAVSLRNSAKAAGSNVSTLKGDFPSDFVKSSDLDSLMNLIDSSTPCKCSLSPLSSFIPTNESAEAGGYAIIFINSFRLNKPVRLGLWRCPVVNKDEADEIRRWWSEYKRTR